VTKLPPGFNRLPQIALWALARVCTQSADGTTSTKQIAKAIDWGPGYDNSRELQQGLYKAIDVLVDAEFVTLGPGNGSKRYDCLSLRSKAVEGVRLIERECLSRDIKALADLRDLAKVNRLLVVDLLRRAIREGQPPAGVEAARYEKILRAKMFQEYVLGLEELGALCHAVRRRYENGILYQYLNYKPENVEAFYQLVRQERQVHLDQLLMLPARYEMRAKLSPEQATEMFEFFDNFSEWLPQCAEAYLTEPMVDAMNKIKHGFVIIEDASVLAQLNLPEPSDVAVILGNAWNPLGAWDAQWTFVNTALREEFDEMLPGTLENMYTFQNWLIKALTQLHNRGVDLACYQPRGSAIDLTGTYSQK
jgi:hypothetical protein